MANKPLIVTLSHLLYRSNRQRYNNYFRQWQNIDGRHGRHKKQCEVQRVTFCSSIPVQKLLLIELSYIILFTPLHTVYLLYLFTICWSISGSKLRGIGFESQPSRMFVLGVVRIKLSRLFKGLECAVLSMVLCTIKKHCSRSIRVEHIPDFGLPSVAIMS